jgi:hypothetical protein
MDPREPDLSSSGPEEALRRLEERLARASEAAERLMTEATSGGRAREGPPPAGWQQAGSGQGSAGDVELFSQILGSLRDLIPPELQRRLADALRELLLALRALIDWYLERSEQLRATASEVEDIPIS